MVYSCTTWVCFDCMTVARRRCQGSGAVCPTCHKSMVSLGTRWRVPKRSRMSWKKFQEMLFGVSLLLRNAIKERYHETLGRLLNTKEITTNG